MSIRISIVGATGYTGGELLRLLGRHPGTTVVHVTSESFAGQPIHRIHTFLKGRLGLLCEKLNLAVIAQESDVVFLCLPHGAAAKTAAALIKKNVRVIDLSADFRLRNLHQYEQWYGKHAAPAAIKEAVFGLPERYREKIKTAQLIANPGCYATTAILAGLPLMAAKNGLGRGPVIVDAKSGISGAGRKLETPYLYCEANESMLAYGLQGHRHHPEILQEWTAVRPLRARTFDFTFVPHLVPMNRGIFVTAYFPLAARATSESLRERYLSYYIKEPFVTVLEPGESPEVKAVSYSNRCQIGVSVSANGRQAIVLAATDNLVKGASGQALQNMNIMFGLDETLGLL